MEGAAKKAISSQTANSIFDLMDRFAGYGFNKSHATCYSIVAYQTAFLKAHYPDAFMAANLTSEMSNSDRIVILIDECRRMGISVLPPDVNTGMADFIVCDEGIRFGLGAIKNVGRGAIESIIQTREEKGSFRSVFEFCERVNMRQVNKKVLESLIQVGAMDSLEGTRAQKMAVLANAMQIATSTQQRLERGQTTIFGEDESAGSLYPDLPEVEAWTQAEKLRREKELAGFYISGHPLAKYKEEVEAFSSPTVAHLSDCVSGKKVRICGIITEVRTLLDRRDKPMAFFTVEDFSGPVRMVAFSDVYEQTKDCIKTDIMVLVEGSLDRKNESDENTILATKIFPIEEARKRCTKRLSMHIRTDKLEEEGIDRIHFLLKKYRGSCPVYFSLDVTDGDILMKSKKYRVNPHSDLLKDLRLILGEQNVWIEG